MKAYEQMRDTLSFYGVQCNQPYYVSSGNPVFKFPKALFRMDFYSFCICVSGNILLEIDNCKYVIKQKELLVSAPSTVVKFLSTSQDFRMKLVFFEKNFLLKNISNPFVIEKLALFKNTSFKIVKPDEETFLQLSKTLDYLKKKASSEGKFKEEIIRTVIFHLLLEVAAFIDGEQNRLPERNSKSVNVFFRFMELVQANVKQYRDVQCYADRLHVSNKYLIEIVKKATGKPPHQIIDEALLKEAYVLLGNPQYNITQIADMLRFSSVSAFGRFFKNHSSVSPSEYRNQQDLS